MKIDSNQSKFFQLIFAVIVFYANATGVLFTLMVNRALTLTELSEYGLYSNLIMIVSIISLGLGISVNRLHLDSKSGNNRTTQKLGTWSLIISLLLFVIYLLITRLAGPFVFMGDDRLIFVSSLIFLIMTPLAWLRGVIQAEKLFLLASLGIFSEATIKLGLGYAFMPNQSMIQMVTAIVLAAGITLALLWLATRKKVWWQFRGVGLKLSKNVKVFWGQTTLQRIGVILILSIDFLMAKYFLEPKAVGVYFLVSTVGKMIYFFSQSFYFLVTPLVAPRLKSRKSRQRTMFLILLGTLATSFLIIALISFWPEYSLKLMLPERYELILSYVGRYALAATLLSVLMILSLYQLIQYRYSISVVVFMAVLIEIGLIILNHESVEAFVNNVLVTSVFSLGVYIFLVMRERLSAQKS